MKPMAGRFDTIQKFWRESTKEFANGYPFSDEESDGCWLLADGC